MPATDTPPAGGPPRLPAQRERGRVSAAENLASLRAAAATGRLRLELGWFHRYPARFGERVLASMIAGVLRRLQGPLELLVDPFVGTGATLGACRQLGLASVGVELSTLGVEISRLRLDPPPDIDDALAMVEGWTRTTPAVSSGLDDELKWWLGDDNARALTGYLRRLADVEDPRQARFATVAISQALRPASRWLVGSVKVTADSKRTPPPIDGQLRRWARAIAGDCRDEAGRVRLVDGSAAASAVVLGDACRLPLADHTADAAVTSPPYFVTYDYFEVNRLSYLAFDWPRPRSLQVGMRYGNAADGVGFVPPNALRRWYEEDFGGERRVFGRALRAYCQRMSTHLDELARVLRPGGVLAYAVADSNRAGKRFALVRACRELLDEAGFEVLGTTTRHLGDTHILPVARDLQSGQFASAGVPGVVERIIYAQRR